MKISELINHCDLGIEEVVADVEFHSLALSGTGLEIDFCTFIDHKKYIDSLSDGAKMIITSRELAGLIKGRGICISSNPRISFFKLHNYLAEKVEYARQAGFETRIGANCKISRLACIAERNVQIGDNVVIEEFVSIKENTIIGNNSIIRAGSVIGGEGFEFKRIDENKRLPVRHVGWVRIGEDVELQQKVCVDRAIYPWDQTIIEDNCKLDNFVHIAHGVKLSKGVLIAAGTFMGGRTIIKENAWIGVGTVLSNGLVIGKNARVNIGAVVTKNVEDNGSVSGNFAIDHKRFIEFLKTIR